MSETIAVWSWRQAIMKSKLPAMTKHVLITLESFMNSHGSGCYPSQKTIAQYASMTERSVIKHIDDAIKAGFLVKKKRGLKGYGWDSNEYMAAMPTGFEGINPIQTGVNDVHIGGEGDSCLPQKRGEGDSHIGVNDVHINYPIVNIPIERKDNTTYYPKESPDTPPAEVLPPVKNSQGKISYPPDFETFWDAYPVNGASKSAAFKSYQKAIARSENGSQAIAEAAQAYAGYCLHTDTTIAHATTWLNQDRFSVDYRNLYRQWKTQNGQRPNRSTRNDPQQTRMAIAQGIADSLNSAR